VAAILLECSADRHSSAQAQSASRSHGHIPTTMFRRGLRPESQTKGDNLSSRLQARSPAARRPGLRPASYSRYKLVVADRESTARRRRSNRPGNGRSRRTRRPPAYARRSACRAALGFAFYLLRGLGMQACCATIFRLAFLAASRAKPPPTADAQDWIPESRRRYSAALNPPRRRHYPLHAWNTCSCRPKIQAKYTRPSAGRVQSHCRASRGQRTRSQ
jgi:hypothetical protein